MSTYRRVPVTPDADVDLHVARQRRQRVFDPVVLAVIAVGGVVGSEARFALHAWSPGDGGWPWGTWWANVAGSLLLGGLMVVLTELSSPHRLLRPFLGVGVIGGFTTFSTVMVEVPGLMVAGRPGMALGYLVGTAVTALGAAAVGVTAVRTAAVGWQRLRRRRSR